MINLYQFSIIIVRWLWIESNGTKLFIITIETVLKWSTQSKYLTKEKSTEINNTLVGSIFSTFLSFVKTIVWFSLFTLKWLLRMISLTWTYFTCMVYWCVPHKSIFENFPIDSIIVSALWAKIGFVLKIWKTRASWNDGSKKVGLF